MLKRFVKLGQSFHITRRGIFTVWDVDMDKEDALLKKDFPLNGIEMEEIDALMADETDSLISGHYPKLTVSNSRSKPIAGHNLLVVQPWSSSANFSRNADPYLQLEECVSLGNTIHNWQVVGKKVVFSRFINKRQIFGEKGLEEFRELLASYPTSTAVFFGIEVLSGVQISILEKELRMPVYDRFTMVLNIFRQHARTKESKIQVALAELPYIRSNLREIHESSEYSSSAESLKMLVGGIGEKFYRTRLDILKKRERRLRALLQSIREQREVTKKWRRKHQIPTVSVVGYTNSGKTSLIKCLTNDENICPKDQLFATLDVSVHRARLPSCERLLLVDTVGFISRIPTLLLEAFSATLKDIQESNLIVHVLDVAHPDSRLQYTTVMDALKSLEVPKRLLDSKLTIGNKIDKIEDSLAQDRELIDQTLKKCDIKISCLQGTNMQELTSEMDSRLAGNLNYQDVLLRVANGGKAYVWLRKNTTITNCQADEEDGNYLLCRVVMNPAAIGRFKQMFGLDGVLENKQAFERKDAATVTTKRGMSPW